MPPSPTGPSTNPTVFETLDRVRSHQFHPLNEKTFTADRDLGVEGIADLDDDDWSVRLLAVRDLIRAGGDAVSEIARGLRDDDVQVRYVCATALGVLGVDDAVDDLQEVARNDPSPLARSQAAVALGHIGAERSLATLRDRHDEDSSKDVRHQIEVAIDRIEKGENATDELRAVYRNLDPETFGRLKPGDAAPDFSLPDTEGETWQLSEAQADGEWVVLIWVFADWCPVCHREFDELIDLRAELEAANVTVATVECHDRYRGRVMVGEEFEPDYWFAEESFQEAYTDRIWWPHLLDRAGAVGATYGVDPMAFSVHAEYINRPATVVIDPEGEVRFAYFGTYWGDRPSVEETLDMVRTEDFDFEHPERRHPNDD
ncbi:redoxin domain-containing protein [Halorussus amylolyticus]|uniref:redoxin domain-containing protein n=1 Tax=Halorussus amylolyticus TaxID=1126242 RepID=UPI00104696F8|nr:redoxin domain-containing protein [Halorussus amylolyticus]